MTLDESDKPEAKGSKALLEEARANYKIAHEWFDHNRKAWKSDAQFAALDQWPEAIRKKREADGLPCLVVDKLNQYVRQVVNDGRQNRPAIKVRPVDDGADVDAAKGFMGHIRSICNRSNADEAFDKALEHAASNGFGYIRVLTEYAHEKTFNQEIAIRRVRNPLTVLLGPHEMADGSDAMFGFVECDVPKAKYAKQYPQAKVVDWQHSGYSDGWADENNVKVCEYFYKVEEEKLLHLLADGSTATDEDIELAFAETGKKPAIKESRIIPCTVVKWARLSGAEVLEEKEWKSRYIPIVPVYGNESDIDGKVTYSGLIRTGRDPQVLHNFARTAFAQRVALTPKAPWLLPVEATDDFEEWKTANTGNHQGLRYRSIAEDGSQIPPPSRINPSDVPAGFAQEMQNSEHDIQGALGMYNASLGEKSNEKSGRAIMARQREGDTATFHYQDNLNRAIRQVGRILVDLIPKIYDGTRTARLLGEDGETTEAQIDPRQEVAYQNVGGKSIYNFGVGIYDVDVATGPSYTTKRQESAEAMIELTRANPTMWQTHGDLIVKSQDWPNADEFAKRSKIVLPPEIRKAIDAEDQGEEPELVAMREQMRMLEEQAQAAIQEREAEIQELSQKLQALETSKALEMEKLQLERDRMMNEQPDQQAAIRAMELDYEDRWKKLEAETKVIVAEIQARQATDTAGIAAEQATQSAAMQGEREVQQPAQPVESKTDTALALALQGFQEALTQLRAPRTATLPDGRQIRVE